ncbi:hypothetical protein [Stieleria varia]|uniref:Uncharacterized protein n=1 Tax=Stieleria varia TaxID=2528005 RepID=A0A5C6B2P9_9BACT|nr:hypothetical protein [Stieleria varia]TWU04704.1 hypothetical protein Pla52n_27460 [Stieleria varia]
MGGKYETTSMQVSKSKSGITRDGTRFVVVYKLQDGGYSEPIKLRIDDAIGIAKRFRDHRKGDRSRSISASAAKYVYKKISEKGLLTDEVSANSEDPAPLPSHDTPDAKSNLKSDSMLAPVYLPYLEVNREPQVSDEMVDQLAFLLSGIDPAARNDPKFARSGVTMRDLIQQTEVRVSTSRLLYTDHRYVLIHLRNLDDDAFRAKWNEAKEQPGGQDATDLIKLTRRLEKLDLENASEIAKNSEEAELILQIQSRAVDLLVRRYRRTQRKLDEINRSDSKPAVDTRSQGGWLSRLNFFNKKESEVHNKPVPVDEAAHMAARAYLDHCVQLGRVLRTDVAKRAVADQ